MSMNQTGQDSMLDVKKGQCQIQLIYTFWYEFALCLGSNRKPSGTGPSSISDILIQSAQFFDSINVSKSLLPHWCANEEMKQLVYIMQPDHISYMSGKLSMKSLPYCLEGDDSFAAEAPPTYPREHTWTELIPKSGSRSWEMQQQAPVKDQQKPNSPMQKW